MTIVIQVHLLHWLDLRLNLLCLIKPGQIDSFTFSGIYCTQIKRGRIISGQLPSAFCSCQGYILSRGCPLSRADKDLLDVIRKTHFPLTVIKWHTIRPEQFKFSGVFPLFNQFVFSSTGSARTRMGVKRLVIFLLVVSLCLDGGTAKEKGTKKGKKKGKQVYCPSWVWKKHFHLLYSWWILPILHPSVCCFTVELLGFSYVFQYIPTPIRSMDLHRNLSWI